MQNKSPKHSKELHLDKNCALLEKLTIVIPTYGRNYYLSRALLYYAQFPFGEIIVADSSQQNKIQINKKIVQSIQKNTTAKIQHLEFEQETEKYGGDIYKKWSSAIQRVETEYSIISTDKEFFIPETLIKCIEFLDANPDFAICEGEYYYIESPRDGEYTTRNMYPAKRSLLQDEATSRINAAKEGKNISSNQMGLRRAEFHKSLYRKLESDKIDDIRFGEFTLEFLTLIRSKAMYLKMPYCYRDICNLSTKNTLKKNESSSLRYPYLDTYQKEGIYDTYFERFVNCLAPEIVEHSSLNLKEAESFIKTELPKIIKMRGFYGNTKFTQDPLWYIWRHSPALLKTFGNHFVPKKYLDYSNISTPNEEYIVNIIEKTKHLHETDSPVIDTSMF